MPNKWSKEAITLCLKTSIWPQRYDKNKDEDCKSSYEVYGKL